jgi:hypothetical protein
MIELSPAVDALFPALHKAQGALTGVVKDGKNPAFKSRYATLENVIDAAKPALQSADLAFTQAPGALVEGAIEITTMIMHTSGQWLRSTLHVPLSKRDPQGVGSAITYGLRYSLMATLGLPPVDDDGESAMDRNSPSAPMPGRNAPVSSGTKPAHSETGATLSDAANGFLLTMKMSRCKADLREWYEANKFDMRAALSEVEVAHVIQERNKLGFTLPEFLEAAE